MNLTSSTSQLLARKEFKLRDTRFEMNGRVRILWLHVMIVLIEWPGKDETKIQKFSIWNGNYALGGDNTPRFEIKCTEDSIF